MVDDIWLAPFGTVGPRDGCGLGHPCIEQEIIELGRTELLEGLLGKGLDIPQVRQFQRQHSQAVRRGIKPQIIIRLLGGLGVAGAQDESVRFGLCEELPDQFEALRGKDGKSAGERSFYGSDRDKQTRPEEAPVATTVFAARLAMLERDLR